MRKKLEGKYNIAGVVTVRKVWISLLMVLVLNVFFMTKGSIAQINAELVLVNAASIGNLEEVKELLKSGVNVNAWNDKGSAPLMTAASGGSSVIVRFLLDNGADVNA